VALLKPWQFRDRNFNCAISEIWNLSTHVCQYTEQLSCYMSAPNSLLKYPRPDCYSCMPCTGIKKNIGKGIRNTYPHSHIPQIASICSLWSDQKTGKNTFSW